MSIMMALPLPTGNINAAFGRRQFHSLAAMNATSSDKWRSQLRQKGWQTYHVWHSVPTVSVLYVQGHIPGRLLCNVNTIFLLFSQ